MLPKALPTVPYFDRVQLQPVRQRSNQAARQVLGETLGNDCPTMVRRQPVRSIDRRGGVGRGHRP
jgi:hypothetical protein